MNFGGQHRLRLDEVTERDSTVARHSLNQSYLLAAADRKHWWKAAEHKRQRS